MKTKLLILTIILLFFIGCRKPHEDQFVINYTNMINGSYLLIDHKAINLSVGDSTIIPVDINLWQKVFVILNTDVIYRIKTEPKRNEIIYIAPARL